MGKKKHGKKKKGRKDPLPALPFPSEERSELKIFEIPDASSPSPFIEEEGEESQLFAGLLERMKMHWLLGEFGLLSRIELGQIQDHPDRSKLAVFLALGKAELGRLEGARECLHFALRWGCSRGFAARVLLADAHRSLGKGFSYQEDSRKGLLQQQAAESLLGAGTPLQGLEPQAPLPGIESLAPPANGEAPRSGIDVREVSKPVVVVAGMRHSGSTALFNILRLALLQTRSELVSYYSEHENCAEKVRTTALPCLVKTHEYRDDVRELADVVFTTRRDLRDTVASAVRRDFPLLKNMAAPKPVEYAKFNRNLHEIWGPHSAYEFEYEKFLRDPETVIREVLAVVGLEDLDPSLILAQVLDLPQDDYATTLLSPSHITDPTHSMRYNDTLSPDFVARISLEHFDWLSKYGYS